MGIAFVWIVFFLSLGVRLSTREGEIVGFALVSSVVVCVAALVADRRRTRPGRPMVAFAVVAPWLTFDVRGWWRAIGTAWDHRLQTAHGFTNLGGQWDHAVERQWDEMLRSGGFAAGIAALAGLSWWLSGKVDWSKRLSSLRVVSVLVASATLVMMGVLITRSRDLPELDQLDLRSLPAVATLFNARHGEPPPREMDGKPSPLEVGEGVTAIRECNPGCRLVLLRPPRASCSLERPNLRVPAVLRRDAKRDLWFFDDGVDLLAYRGSDLRCIDLSLRDLLLDIKPSPAWLWGAGIGLALALLGQVSAWLFVRRARQRGSAAADDVARVRVTLEAFTVAILFATMPPLISTLLGAHLW